ncbi:MAG: hypothetical protein Q8S84_03760 [bacterium]|nr:hypothetical protein [bacterium]
MFSSFTSKSIKVFSGVLDAKTILNGVLNKYEFLTSLKYFFHASSSNIFKLSTSFSSLNLKLFSS